VATTLGGAFGALGSFVTPFLPKGPKGIGNLADNAINRVDNLADEAYVPESAFVEVDETGRQVIDMGTSPWDKPPPPPPTVEDYVGRIQADQIRIANLKNNIQTLNLLIDPADEIVDAVGPEFIIKLIGDEDTFHRNIQTRRDLRDELAQVENHLDNLFHGFLSAHNPLPGEF
jgi:hypothetical protein